MSVRPPVCPQISVWPLTGRIFVKFDMEVFYKKKICRETPESVEIGQKCRALCMKN
jgi:hypothetical protein